MTHYYIAPVVSRRAEWPVTRRQLWGDARISTQQVPVDVVEQADRFVLTAQLPGMKAEDISISLEKGILTLEGTAGYSREAEGSYPLAERMTGSFKRSFRLPASVDASSVDAKLADGILTLEIPKAPEAQPKMIKVN